jgi:hypothetical protein
MFQENAIARSIAILASRDETLLAVVTSFDRGKEKAHPYPAEANTLLVLQPSGKGNHWLDSCPDTLPNRLGTYASLRLTSLGKRSGE